MQFVTDYWREQLDWYLKGNPKEINETSFENFDRFIELKQDQNKWEKSGQLFLDSPVKLSGLRNNVR